MNILMVCLGNICRSPLAEGIMKHLIKENDLDWVVDSSGTSGWHNGELPDSRSVDVASENGIDISDQRSRKLISEDLSRFDLILAMDVSNYNDILKLAQNDEQRDKVKMILNFSFPNQNRNVPDPYYEGGFSGVYNMLYKACEEIIKTYR